MASAIAGYNYDERNNKDLSWYNRNSSIQMGLLESDTFGNIRQNRPYLIRGNGALRRLRLYTLWSDSHPEMLPEWIVYCAKHGLITLDGTFGFISRSSVAKKARSEDIDMDDVEVSPTTYTYNRYGKPYDHIPQDVAYASTYQEKLRREGVSDNVLRQIQQVIWNSNTWTSSTNSGTVNNEVTSSVKRVEDRGRRLAYNGWAPLMFDQSSEWDSMKNGLANQVTLPSVQGKRSIAGDEEIVTRSEDFANFQYLVGNESLYNKEHVTEIDIHESNIDGNSNTSSGNYQNKDNTTVKTFIDQESKTITMGPYKLGIFNTTGSNKEEITNRLTKDGRMTLSDLVRNEILRKNRHQTKENTFLIGEFGVDFGYQKENFGNRIDSTKDVDIETYYGKINAYANDTNKYQGKTGKFQLVILKNILMVKNFLSLVKSFILNLKLIISIEI